MDQVTAQRKGIIKLLALVSLLAVIILCVLYIPIPPPLSKSPTVYNEYSIKSTYKFSSPYSILTERQFIASSNTSLVNTSDNSTSYSSTNYQNYLTIEPLDGSIGRLGNFLFRYAAAKGIAERNHLKLVLPDTKLVREYRTIFNLEAAVASEVSDYHDRYFVELHEKAWGHFDPTLFTLHPGQDYKLQNVYSQSFKYFEHIENRIREEFTTMGPHHSNASSLIKSLKYYNQNKTIISLHVRRGDFLLPNLNSFGYAVAPAEYFKRAINYFILKYGLQFTLFLISSDDRLWCMQNLKFQGAVHYYTGGSTAMDDFMTLLMSNHHIVSVGSFSWWLAWLGRGEVVYFKHWPRPGSPHARNCNPRDYYPPEWKPMV